MEVARKEATGTQRDDRGRAVAGNGVGAIVGGDE